MPAWLTNLYLRLKALALRRRFEAGLHDELRFHLEMREQRYRERGTDPESARYAALLRVGNATLFQEQMREMRTFTRFETIWRDVVLAGRLLRRDPAFSLLATLVLALGIGVNIAAFSVMDAILIRMLPVEDPGSLFRIAGLRASADDATGGACSFALFRDMQARTQGLAELTAYNLAARQSVSLTGSRELQLYHQIVSGNYFQVLGLRASYARLLTPGDDAAGSSPVAVISNRFWKEGFGGSAAAIGSWVKVEGQPFEIIGVAPDGFFGVEIGKMVDVWTPVAMAPAENLRNDHSFWLHPMGRLLPGATLAQAEGPISSIVNQFMLEDVRQHAPAGTPQAVINRFLDDMKVRGIPAGGGVASLRKDYRQALQAVMALALMVLFICCTNVANLLHAKGTVRQREIGLRLSLGAGRLRILQQLVIESVPLSVAATLMGAVFSHWTTPFFARMLRPSVDAVELSIHFDARLFAFATLLAVTTVLISGLLPAIQILRPDIVSSLGGRTGLTTNQTSRHQKVLVVTQVALSFVLVAGAILFSRTLTNLLATPLGFVPNDILVSRVALPRAGDEVPGFPAAWTQLLERLRTAPDIQEAALSSATLFDGEPPYAGLRSDAKRAAPVPPTAAILFVSAGYFRTLGIPLTKGRSFEERDFQPNASPAVVVNQAFAAKFYGAEEPLHHQLTKIADAPDWSEIVGVVRDVRVSNLRGPAPPILYVPYTAYPAWVRPEGRPGSEMTLQVRRRRSHSAFLPELQRLAGRQFRVAAVSAQQQLIDDTPVRERLLSRVADLFGILCVVLAALGLYAVLTYSILQRRRDIGIRVALGASPGTILASLMLDAGRVILIGIMAGAALAILASRAARALLFGLTSTDPVTYIGAALVLLVTLYAAALIPAWKAAISDPIAALRIG